MSTGRDVYLRLSELERKVSDLYARLGQAEPEPRAGADAEADPQLIELITAGKKAHAIKLYRELTGNDLYAAKEAVERLAKTYGLR